MKNRKLILIVSLVLALTMSLGGTLAYLTDTDADVNTMVLGNVDIEQHEYQRAKDENGVLKTETIDGINSYVLEGFAQDKPLLPTTEVDENGKPVNWGAGNWDGTTVLMSQVESYGDVKVFKSPLAVDKFVTVENTGKTDAYVRTYIAFEAGAKNYDAWEDLVGINVNSKVWKITEIGIVEIKGNNYNVKEFTYIGSEGVRHENGILPAGDTTYPSLAQIYLDSRADNEDMVEFDGNANGTFDILVLSQAIQADGFDTAAAAFKASFNNGADTVTKEMIQSWFEGDDSTDVLPSTATVKTLKELKDALDGANKAASNTTITLGADIEGDVFYSQDSAYTVYVDGNGHTFKGLFTVSGDSAAYETTKLIIDDINFVANDKVEDSKKSCIEFGSNGTSSERYVNNVTISNCTFSDPTGNEDHAAIRSFTGGDKNVTIENCTVYAGMHSLLQVANVAGLEIENCKVYSKNGVNLNQTPAMEMSGCAFDVQGYAVRIGVSNATVSGNYAISDSSLKSACAASDDAVIVCRGEMAGSTLTLTNTTLIGTPDITGNANIIR